MQKNSYFCTSIIVLILIPAVFTNCAARNLSSQEEPTASAQVNPPQAPPQLHQNEELRYLKDCQNKDLFGTTFPFKRKASAKEITFPAGTTVTTEDYTLAWSKQWEPKPGCFPKALYRWTGETDIRNMVQRFKDNKGIPDEDINSVLYFWRSPSGSFAYGHQSYRIKLNADTVFMPIPMYGPYGNPRICRTLTKVANAARTVYVATMPNSAYHEYIICNFGAFGSASFYTKEHLDELKKDLSKIEVSEPSSYDMMVKRVIYDIADIRKGYRFDNTDWKLSDLKDRYVKMEQLVQKTTVGDGHFFTRQQTNTTRKEHFAP